MYYLAFDIEAANGYKLSSICSIGIVIADENFNVKHRENIWINPRSKYNLNGTRKKVGIDLHLDKDLLAASPDFAQVYGRIKTLLTDKNHTVIGHAVESDVRMLNAACNAYKLPSIDFDFICTQLLYRLYKKEKNVKALNKIAAELSLEYNEHNSEDDAWMSLMTLKYLTEDSKLPPEALLEKFHVRTGSNKDFQITRTVSLDEQTPKRKVRQGAVNNLKQSVRDIKPLGTEMKKLSFSIARSLEMSGSDEVYRLVKTIAEKGGKYVPKLSMSNVYVRNTNPTEQDAVREKRVAELQEQGLITVVTADEILKKAGDDNDRG